MSSYYGNFCTTRYLCCSRVCSRRPNALTTLLYEFLHLLQCCSAVCRLEKGEKSSGGYKGLLGNSYMTNRCQVRVIHKHSNKLISEFLDLQIESRYKETKISLLYFPLIIFLKV